MNRTSRPLLMATIASVVAVTGASALGVAASAAPAAPHHATAKHSLTPFWAASGASYASLLQVGNTIQSAKSALTELGCGADGSSNKASTPDLNLGALGSLGSVKTSTTAMPEPGNEVKDESGSTTTGISLLGGVIQAQALTSTAWAQHLTSSTVGGVTKLVDLTVLGLPIDTTPKANTTIALPGIGALYLNVQVPTKRNGVLSEDITGLSLHITKALPGIPAGTKLILGHSVASVQKLTSKPLGGSADGDELVVPGLLNSGQTFRNILPCAGTGDKTITQSGVGVNLGDLAQTGAIQTTILGRATTYPESVTSATIGQITLLNGMVKANVIKARAVVDKVKGKAALIRSSAGSELLGLTIAGKSIPTGTIKPNTKINLAGIGTLWLDRTITTARSIQVHMIELDLGTAYESYAAGTVLTVGNANARIKG